METNDYKKELTDKQKSKYKIIRIVIQAILLIAMIALCIFATIKIYPYLLRINSDEVYRDYIINKIKSFGHFSWVIIIGAQILQTVLAFIPSGPIVMISGMLYHPAISVLLCLIGQTLGGLIVYFLVKLLGYRFIALFFNPDKLKNSKLLASESKCEVLIFGYLLIPALPKDIVAFIAPFTNIKWYNFALISFVARTPMTIVTVLMGSSLISGSYYIVFILGAISLLLAVLCFVFNKKIIALLDKIKARVSN